MNIHGIEKEIQSITGNGPVLEELNKLLESGEAIALVGAGASAGLWPLWNEFLQGFITHSLNSGKINSDEATFFQQEAPQTPLETAQQLRHKIGEQLYFEYLYETFSDKISPHTGGAFTLTHRALLQLPIHNYLTLNYDAGLTNARAALYPKATTSYYFWDQEEARRIRDRNYKRQVLHAHGRYDRADSIILTLDDYRRAYDRRGFVRLLEDFFAFEKLLILGFGMSAPYIKQLFNNISGDYKKSPLRHIAFVGLNDKDLQVTHLLRERVEMVYGARILFYPTRNHHQALTDWLTMLAEKYATQTAEEIQPLATPPQLKTVLTDKYIHQPTDDANFKGRVQDFAALNRWANDPATRMIAITGIGGQGKTALVGRWLKQERTPELAQMPVFYWSFYEDLDVGKFLQILVDFVKPMTKVKSKDDREALTLLLEVLKDLRVLVILDGVEVLQEEASSPAHGRINHPQLEQLLQVWLRYPHQSLMILTSRFQFPQLARFSGVGFHHLNLVRLGHADGLSLLQQLGVWGDDRLMGDYVENLRGHPLALRVLASAIKRECLGKIDNFSGKVLLASSGDNRLSQKLERLLSFYERQLKNGQDELLSILSLFKRPVASKSLVTLVCNMKSLKKTPLAKANATDIEKQLDLLMSDFLIEKTVGGITTHPVIRDYFRTRNRLKGSRREAADFLKTKPRVMSNEEVRPWWKKMWKALNTPPAAHRPKNIEEVRDLVDAVQLLCDEGAFVLANSLRWRLFVWEQGFDTFRNFPAVAEGLDLCLAFVGNEARIQKVEETLGRSYVASYCSGVSGYHLSLGNLAQSLEWRKKSLEFTQSLLGRYSRSFDLNEISSIEMIMGNIKQARENTSLTWRRWYEAGNLSNLKYKFDLKAYSELLLGNTYRAYQIYRLTSSLSILKVFRGHESASSASMGTQSEFFLRICAWEPFELINTLHIQICKTKGWNRDLARCYLLKGRYEIHLKELSNAEIALRQAEHFLRPSGMVLGICHLDHVWGLLAEAKGEHEKGLQRANDALFTAADKGFRLRQADLLVLRGRLRLGMAKSNLGKTISQVSQNPTAQVGLHSASDLLEQAGDDAYETLKIAEQTGYIWPKVEALELLAAYHQTRAALSGFNSQDEKDKAQSYAHEAASIKKGLLLTEEQMQELKTQARQEFEKQIAEWEKKL
ncbi:hypothetical protein DCC62_23910 [candidate division KSB1 bacterium]|nr:MAG: hypothetical protein DCC62_23910 [candidate division KSB1 bacterium]